MAKDYNHLFKLLIIGDSGKYVDWCSKYIFLYVMRVCGSWMPEVPRPLKIRFHALDDQIGLSR